MAPRRPPLTDANTLLPPGARDSMAGIDEEDLDGNTFQTSGKAQAKDIGSEDEDLGEFVIDEETGDMIYGAEEGSEEDQEEDAEQDTVDLEEFFENLATNEDVKKEVESYLGILHDLVEEDIEARSDRDEQYTEGIKRTGVGKEAPGGADFDGASKAVHPILAEGSIDFAARILKEMLPPGGPVKTHIVGSVTKEKLAKAERKRRHMNWQLTQQIPEYRPETEQLLVQTPLGGSQYCRWWYAGGRPHYEFLPIDLVILSQHASNFDTAERITIREDSVTEAELQNRVLERGYLEPTSVPSSVSPDQTQAEQATDKIEGVKEPGTNLDGVRGLFSTYLWLDLESDDKNEGKKAPYFVVYEQQTKALYGVWRNWDPTIDQDSQLLKRMDWLVQWDFIRWRGALAVGLAQLIGSLSGSVTGGIRALLDTAHINNSATLLKLKGANIGGQSTSIDITGVAEIDGPAGIDDIRKLAMPVPFNPPSNVLFELVQWLCTEAKQTMATAEEALAKAGPNSPVGTVMALVEQGSVTFSSIHARFHESQRRSLEILHRINKFWLEDEQVIEDLGELVVKKSDYEGPMDIIPVSDPAIFSEVQRVTQLQALLDMRTLFPGKLNDDAILKRALQTLKVPNIEEVFPEQKKPEPENPINENLKMFMGQPAFAFPDQPHEAHLQCHIGFMLDQQFGSSEAFMASVVPQMVEHLKQHIGFWYVDAALEILSDVSGVDVSKLDFTTPEMQDSLAKALAEATPFVMEKSKRVLGPVMGLINQAAKMAQEMQQQQLQMQMAMAGGGNDPSRMAEVQRKQAKDQADTQIKGQQLQLEGQRLQLEGQKLQNHQQDLQQRRMSERERNQMQLGIKQLELQHRSRELDQAEREYQRQLMIAQRRQQLEEMAQAQQVELDWASVDAELQKMDVELLKNEQDNWTALQIAEKNLQAKETPRVKNGNAIGE